MLQISSDGPNVNLKFIELYVVKRELDEFPCLVDLGTCDLHTGHGGLKNGIKCSGWNTGKLLKALLKLVDESPARRDTYTKVTESEDFPLLYCGHWWCENENCVNQAEMIWSGYIQFIEVLNKRPKSKQPQGKSFFHSSRGN